MSRQVERTTWEKASAMPGMLAWPNEKSYAVTKKWLERATTTQTSEGNLSYSEFANPSTGNASICFNL